MFSVWFSPEGLPEARAKIRPLTGPYLLDLERTQFGGQAVYDAFRFCVTDWEHAPLLGGDDQTTGFDLLLVDQLKPGFVFSVIMEAMRLSTLSEEERKNSSSQSTSGPDPS